MKRFMIGQFNSFDLNKQNRDFRDYFYGIEVNQIESMDELEILKKNIIERNLNIGIHFPLLKNQWLLRDPQYLSLNETTYMESISYMESQIKIARSLNPDYILLHYPKPVILDEEVDWSTWRFADTSEYYFESQISFECFEERSRSFFKKFSEAGRQYSFVPVLELDGLNKYIYKTDLLENLLNQYPNIRLCLDFGRIHLQDCIDVNFKGLDIVRKFGEYTHLVHLWNSRIGQNEHYPALKSLRTDEGWGDMEAYLKALNGKNDSYKVLFEHQSNLISDSELEECYKWIFELVSSPAAGNLADSERGAK